MERGERMTNTVLFRKRVEEIGVTYTALALKIGITREALYRKINNETEFKASEITACTNILQLSNVERDKIFFDMKLN